MGESSNGEAFLAFKTSASPTAPVTTNPMDETLPGSINIRILIPKLMIIIFGLVGLMGNAIVFWLLGFHLRRNAFSVYILNLALADFLFLLSSIIASTLFLLKVSYLSIIFHLCFNTIMMVVYITGISMLSAISTECCLSVLCPTWYRCHRPVHTSTVMCAVIWVLSLLICILNSYFCAVLHTRYDNDNECLATNIFTASYMIFLLVVFCLSSLALLARLFCGAGQMKLTRFHVTILLTLLVFLLCGLPFVIYCILLFKIKDDFHVLDVNLYLALEVLTAINSCANPIIYFFVGSFRHRLKHQTLKMVLQSALQDTPETAENMVEMSSNKAEP